MCEEKHSTYTYQSRWNPRLGLFLSVSKRYVNPKTTKEESSYAKNSLNPAVVVTDIALRALEEGFS